MKLKTARLEVWDENARRFDAAPGEKPRIHVKEKRFRLQLITQPPNTQGRAALAIRLYDTQPEQDIADRIGGDDHLLDWYEVEDPNITIYSGRLTVVGYMFGTDGLLRNGRNPLTGKLFDPNVDDRGPLARVRWDFE